jgi:integrase
MTNLPAVPVDLGEMANRVAAGAVFDLYADEMSQATLETQVDALNLFARYLGEKKHATTGPRLATDPAQWRGITWGLVEGFKQWMKESQGFAIGTINNRLSVVRTYAALAHKAGVIEPEEASLIAAVTNIRSAAGMNIDSHRATTRVSTKKANFNTLSRQEVQALLDQPDTPRGRRDAAVIATLYYFGTRAEEAAGIQVSDVNMIEGLVHVFRPKVKGTDQAHGVYDLNAPEFAPARRAYESYHRHDAPPIGMFFRGSIQNSDELGDHPMTRVTISQLVATLGRRIGFSNLSAHDLRHTGATHIAATDNNLIRLRDWGGWNSIQMPARYAKRAKTANEGVRFG